LAKTLFLAVLFRRRTLAAKANGNDRSRRILLKNSFSTADHNFAAPWRRRHKKDAGDQWHWRKIRRNPPLSIIGGIEREKSLAIEFGRIFRAPNFSSFSTQSAERGPSHRQD
jgi:hypothetical protein